MPKFKIGDEVRIKGKSVCPDSLTTFREKYPAMKGKIDKICGDGSGEDMLNCLVIRDKGDGGWFFAPKDLELINKPIYITHKEYLKIRKRTK